MDLRADYERCWQYLAPAVEAGGDTHTKDDVWASIADDPKTLFWPGRTSAAVTEVLHFPRKAVMNLWLVGGDLDELLHTMLPAAERQARHWGLDEVWGMGRPGWSKALKPLGYASPTIIVKKTLA